MAEIIVYGAAIAAPAPPVAVTPALAPGLSMVPDALYQGVLSAYVPRPTCVSLSRYCQILAIDERQFYGVMDPPEETQQFYWTGQERRQLAEQLRAAEGLIESELGVPLCCKWQYREQRPFRYPLLLNWGEFDCGGIQAASLYEKTGASKIGVDYTTPDVGIITVPHGDVGSADYVTIFYYDADAPTRLYRTLIPSDIDWNGGNIVITFPKWRLVRRELGMTDDDVPQNLDDDSDFVEYVLVAYHYTDQSEGAIYVGRTQQATGYVQCDDKSISKIRVEPGSYTSGVWADSRTPGFVVRFVYVSYKAGLLWMPFDLEQAVVRLAHSLMPAPVCPAGYEPWIRYWKRDRDVPVTPTRERVNCPWGDTDGAWFAWNVVQRSPFNLRKGGAIYV